MERYGPPSGAFALPQDRLCLWEDPEGAVVYRPGRVWLAVGGPVAAPEHKGAVARRFLAAAKSHGASAAFFGVPAGADWLRGLDCSGLPIGEEAVLGDLTVPSVRALVRRADRRGVTARELSPQERHERHPELQRLVLAWRKRQGLAPMGFLAGGDPLAERPGLRWFVASLKDRLLGCAVAISLGHDQWLIDYLLLDRPVPNGTAELLLACARDRLSAREGRGALREGGESQHAGAPQESGAPREGGTTRGADAERPLRISLGLTALSNLPQGGNSVLARIMRASAEHLNWLYPFHGIRFFRERLRSNWEPLVLACPRGTQARSLWATLVAFSGGRVGRFVYRTARNVSSQPARLREPYLWALVAESIASGLVPWSLILLLCDSERWFGAAWMARAWAAFDVVLLFFFLRLGWGLRHRSRRWVRPLAFGLLGAVLSDTFLTLAQAALYNIPRATTLGDWLAVAVGCTGPVLASCYLVSLLIRAPLLRRTVPE